MLKVTRRGTLDAVSLGFLLLTIMGHYLSQDRDRLPLSFPTDSNQQSPSLCREHCCRNCQTGGGGGGR